MRVYVLEHDTVLNGHALFADRKMVSAERDPELRSLTDSVEDAAQFLTRSEARQARREFPAAERRRFSVVRHSIRSGGGRER